jgi:hypothetical protein
MPSLLTLSLSAKRGTAIGLYQFKILAHIDTVLSVSFNPEALST